MQDLLGPSTLYLAIKSPLAARLICAASTSKVDILGAEPDYYRNACQSRSCLQLGLHSLTVLDAQFLQEPHPMKPPKMTRTWVQSRDLKISQACFSGDAMARPTVAMWVLFQVLLSTSTVLFAMAVV